MLCVMTDKERIWAERVGEWEASGKTLQEFAKDQPYKGLTLRWWGSELRRRGLLGKTSARRGRPGAPAKLPSIRMVRVVRRGDPEPAPRQIPASRWRSAGLASLFNRASMQVFSATWSAH